MGWHIEFIAAKLTALRDGKIRRLIVNLPPRHLKSLLASVAFPAWCLGHDPPSQILRVSYAQDLADKLMPERIFSLGMSGPASETTSCIPLQKPSRCGSAARAPKPPCTP